MCSGKVAVPVPHVTPVVLLLNDMNIVWCGILSEYHAKFNILQWNAKLWDNTALNIAPSSSVIRYL